MRVFFAALVLLTVLGCSSRTFSPDASPGICSYSMGSRCHASGFYLAYNSQTYFVTARHVVTGNKNPSVTDIDDVSVFITKHFGISFSPSEIVIPLGLLPKGRPINIPVTVIGFVRGRLVKTKGFVCGRVLSAEPPLDLVYLTAVVYPGMSGGVVLDSEGKVLGVVAGIVTADSTETYARSLCTPIQRALVLTDNAQDVSIVSDHIDCFSEIE